MAQCQCNAKGPAEEDGGLQEEAGVPAARTVGTLVLGILVAFFPKCPVCWAAYCSALGLAGLSELPYPGILLPVLSGLLLLNLFLLGKQAPKVGFGPLLLGVTGTACLFLFRRYAPELHWGLNGGVLLMVAGFAWNSLALRSQGSQRARLLTRAQEAPGR